MKGIGPLRLRMPDVGELELRDPVVGSSGQKGFGFRMWGKQGCSVHRV